MADTLIKDLLLGDDVAGQVELLLNLLSDAAAGRELSNVVSEVIQVTIAGGVGHQPVKKLAYDLCKAVSLLPSDYSLLVDGIKNDISCGVPETQVLALRFLPHLPPEHLLHLLDKGDIATFVAPHTRNVAPGVRSAATSALCAVLLTPEVQAALAASPDLATAGSDWWDAVVDALGDSMPAVLVAGLAASNALFEAAAAGGGDAASGSAASVAPAAARAALRLAAGIGPLLDTWRMLPSHAQVPVIQLLGHLWSHLLAADSGAAAAASAGQPESSSGSQAAALPGMLAYLSACLASLNPAVKLEAARQILRVSKATAAASAAGGPALMELQGRLLVEAALEEIVSLVAAHLDVLQVPTRLAVLSRLWPMIALLQSPTDRLTAFAHSWRAALQLSNDVGAGGGGGADWQDPGDALSCVLADPFLEDVIAERPAAAGALAASSAAASPPGGDAGGAAAGPTGGAGPAAGPTGASAASGPTGGGLSAADALGLGQGAPAEVPITLRGSLDGGRSRKKLLASKAKGVLSSGAALASNVGGALASAAAALPLRFMDGGRPQKCGPALRGAACTGRADAAPPAPPGALTRGPAPAAARRAQLPATLKQELVCTLLQVLQTHPAAQAALQLPLGKPVPPPPPPAAPPADAAPAANGEAAAPGGGEEGGAADAAPGSPGDAAPSSPSAAAGAAPGAGGAPGGAPGGAARPQFGPGDVSVSPVVASLQGSVVAWLAAAVAALQAARPCLHWEPLVPPPMPGLPPTPPLPPLASVNLTSVPVDLWLCLLQAACQAVRGLVRLHGYDSLKAIYRANGGRMLPQLSPWDAGGALARSAEAAAAALQAMLSRELADWRSLSLAARPRVLWVAAHYLELPSLLDDTWATLLGAVEDALLRAGKAEGDARARQLAASAREGLLLKKFALPQLSNLGRDRSGAHTTFDAAAASALVELPEYRADGLAVRHGGPAPRRAAPRRARRRSRGRAAPRAAARPRPSERPRCAAPQVGLCVLQYLVWVVQATLAAGPGGPGVPAGPAEAVLARKLLDLVRAAGGAEGAGVDVREWCRRMARTLGALLDPSGAGGGTAGGGGGGGGAGGPAFAMAAPAPGAGASGKGGALPGGYNAVAGFSALGFGGGDSSSDDDAPAGLSREARLQRKLGLAGGKGRGGAAAASDSSDAGASSDDDAGSGGSSSSSSESESDAEGGAAGGSSDSDAGGGPSLPNPLSGLQLGAAAGGGGGGAKARRAARKAERAARRAARRRAAAAALAVGAPDAASGVAASGFRLDQAGFWASLPGPASGWAELSGPADPVVLSGRYSAARGAGSAPGEITVTLRAFNRLPVDLEGVEVAVRLAGPVRAERREASWMLPRLLPTEAAQHSFKIMPTGYGRLAVHVRLVLPVPQLASESGGGGGAPALACQPLAVSMAHLLAPPPVPPASAQDMLALWGSLPLQVELSATCVWPGLDGLLLLLSALVRQPLHCAWAHVLPVVCGAQAAFVACPTAHSADSLALMLVGQLMPDDPGEAGSAPPADAPPGAAGAQEGGGGGAPQESGAAAGEAGAQEEGGGAPAPARVPALRGVVQLVVRASSHEVLLAIQQAPEAWVSDVSQGTLAVGVAAGGAPPRPSRGKTLLHPSVARLEGALAPAAPVVPPPPPTPALELPVLPRFRRKLRAKADEEDSDAEDEEVPLTQEEAAEQQAAVDKHAAACDDAREAHEAAKRARAAAVLRTAALAEWRRAACPSLV
ncbi:hypothetical protein HT031_003040 [Scenedesmus sp. PABB004]|nr:hypothetical protein HT031_003040 [Scenedesmus sp. PABB004]